MKIVPFKAPETEPKDSGAMVELLQHLLEEASAGRVHSLALTYNDHEGATGTAWSWVEGHLDGVRLLGGVKLLDSRLTRMLDETE